MDNYKNLKAEYKFKAIFSKELRKQINDLGVCPECKKPNTEKEWCNHGEFLKVRNTSGNPEMDRLLKQAQLKTTYCYNDNDFEWIPYDRLQDIKSIGEGGFTKVFSATWLDGKYDNSRQPTGSNVVALKKFKNSKDTMESFANEIKAHHEFARPLLIRFFYGVTKDPQTDELMIVLAYAKEGNLREYLKTNFSNLKWEEKLNMLDKILSDLDKIYEQGYIHKDLHSGNILQFCTAYNNLIKITDLGLSQSIHNSRSSNISNVCGVLPYIAPEILYGKPYTFASNIYSFGIIMVEMSTGKPPYQNVPHDEKLALAICNGLRPRVAKKTPQCYIDLVNQCLDANPEKRTSVEDLYEIFVYWTSSYFLNRKEIYEDFIDADKFISQESPSENVFHPEAIYTSRYMNFINLPEPKNSTGVQIEDSEVPDSLLIDLHVSDFQRTLDQDLIKNTDEIDLDLIEPDLIENMDEIDLNKSYMENK